MTTPMEKRIEEDSSVMFTRKPLLEMCGSTHGGWTGSSRMIDRIEALRLISRYNAHVSVLDRPERHALSVPENILVFTDQLEWMVAMTDAAEKPMHWDIPELIDNGIRVFIYDHTYVEVTEVSDDGAVWFDIRVLSITGGHKKIDMMCRLLHGLLEADTWLDEPDLDKMIRGLGV